YLLSRGEVGDAGFGSSTAPRQDLVAETLAIFGIGRPDAVHDDRLHPRSPSIGPVPTVRKADTDERVRLERGAQISFDLVDGTLHRYRGGSEPSGRQPAMSFQRLGEPRRDAAVATGQGTGVARLQCLRLSREAQRLAVDPDGRIDGPQDDLRLRFGEVSRVDGAERGVRDGIVV